MNFDDLARRPSAWLSCQGPLGEVVISSRVRLARNLAGFPFLTRATDSQRCQIQRLVWNALVEAGQGVDAFYVDIEQAHELDRQLLVERHLISRQHAASKGSRGVAVGAAETMALMINEEDHIRIQALRSGLQLDEVWKVVSGLDAALEQRIEYAYHPRFGYLTACPTNVGTGLRVSVMLHLPALKLTGEIERVLRATRDMRLAVRGLFGEGTEATGDLYQVSNQTTLGKSEEEIIHDFRHLVVPSIIDYETHARKVLVRDKAAALDDKIFRAYGLLGHARTISSEETLGLLSHVRMGISLGRIKDIDLQTVNDLFLQTQPAHLQKLRGALLDGEQRSIVRAELIRRRLGNGHNPG